MQRNGRRKSEQPQSAPEGSVRHGRTIGGRKPPVARKTCSPAAGGAPEGHRAACGGGDSGGGDSGGGGAGPKAAGAVPAAGQPGPGAEGACARPRGAVGASLPDAGSGNPRQAGIADVPAMGRATPADDAAGSGAGPCPGPECTAGLSPCAGGWCGNTRARAMAAPGGSHGPVAAAIVPTAVAPRGSRRCCRAALGQTCAESVAGMPPSSLRTSLHVRVRVSARMRQGAAVPPGAGGLTPRRRRFRSAQPGRRPPYPFALSPLAPLVWRGRWRGRIPRYARAPLLGPAPPPQFR